MQGQVDLAATKAKERRDAMADELEKGRLQIPSFIFFGLASYGPAQQSSSRLGCRAAAAVLLHIHRMEGMFKDGLLQLLQYFHNPELVGSLLLLYVIHVVGLTVNIPHLFLHGLKFIVTPTEEAVLRIRSDAKGPRPEPLGQLDRDGKEANAYDKMNALGLARMEISRGTLGTLMYFPYYEGMVLWALVGLGNFVIAQGSRCAIPTQRPLGWAGVTLCAALLRAWWCNVRLVYLLGSGNDHSKFASLCGFCGLFAAACAGAMFPADFFAFDLRAAAVALHAWGKGAAGVAAELLSFSAVEADGGASGGSGGSGGGGVTGLGGVGAEDFVALFLPVVSVAAACVTTAAALPAIRFAQYFVRALEPGSGAPFAYRALLVVDFLLPWLATLIWVAAVPPLVLGWLADEEVEEEEGGRGRGGAGLALRVWVTGLAAAARLAVGRFQIQAYLEGVKESVLKDLRQRKVDSHMVRSKFDARFQYLIIAAAQYAAPALTVIFSLAILVHLAGGGPSVAASAATGEVAAGGAGAGEEHAGLGFCDAARRLVGLQPWDAALAATDFDGGPVASSGDPLAGALRNMPDFPEAFWSGVAGFLAWWACLSWAVTYAMGVVFWRVYPEDVSAVELSRSDTTTKGKKEKGKGKAKAKGAGRRGGGEVVK
eukprot:g8237.t1